MAKLQATLATKATATTEVEIEPALKAKLKQRLTKYRMLDAAFDAAKAALDKEAALIEGYFEQVGANSIKVKGHATITEVRGVSPKLDKQLFVKSGGSLQMLEDSTVTTPKKPYVLITLEKV